MSLSRHSSYRYVVWVYSRVQLDTGKSNVKTAAPQNVSEVGSSVEEGEGYWETVDCQNILLSAWFSTQQRAGQVGCKAAGAAGPLLSRHLSVPVFRWASKCILLLWVSASRSSSRQAGTLYFLFCFLGISSPTATRTHSPTNRPQPSMPRSCFPIFYEVNILTVCLISNIIVQHLS